MWELQYDRGVGHGAHLFPEKKKKNTFTSGTNNTEQQLNADRRPQNSEKIGKSPHNWVGLKKRRIQGGACTSRREL